MLRNSADTIYQYDNTLKSVMCIEEIKSSYWTAHSFMLQMALDKDSDYIEARHSTVRALLERNLFLVNEFDAIEPQGEEGLKLYQDFKEKRMKYRQVLKEALKLGLLTTNDAEIEAFNEFSHDHVIPFTSL